MGTNTSARSARRVTPGAASESPVARVPESSTISPSVQLAMDCIRQLVRALRMSAVESERTTGLSGAQLFVLQLLAEGPAESMNDLAARTSTDQSSVSVVVSRLESKGLVVREPAAGDARRITVRITPGGRRLLSGRPPAAQARLQRALELLPHDSLVSLTRELARVTELMGAEREPPSLFFEDDATGSP